MTAASTRALLHSALGSLGQLAPAPVPLGVRWMSVARAGYGATLLCVPGPMITALTGMPVSGRERAVARLLGARQLTQAAVCGLMPTRGLIQAGAAVDGLHAASMMALAGAKPGLRRALLAETAIAGALALTAVAGVHRHSGAAGRVR
jgi:hypothetical protein